MKYDNIPIYTKPVQVKTDAQSQEIDDSKRMPPPSSKPTFSEDYQPNVNQSDISSVSANDSSYISRSLYITPQEEALQSQCKKLLKTTVFRGFYVERRLVELLKVYRDIVALHRSERDLEKLLISVSSQLALFYGRHSPSSTNPWVGITHGKLMGLTMEQDTLDTYCWLELDELAFGQYWFCIKTIRFRDNEIVLKLKVLRPINDEDLLQTPNRRSIRLNGTKASNTRQSFVEQNQSEIAGNNAESNIHQGNQQSDEAQSSERQQHTQSNRRETRSSQGSPNVTNEQIDVQLQDFIDLILGWGTAIKLIIYDFLSNDINRTNLKEVVRFLFLLIFSLLAGGLSAIKYLGVVLMHLMFELNRFTFVSTPIILKLIDIVSKIIGGLFILITMFWRDTFGNRNAQPPPPANFEAIEYNRPSYANLNNNAKIRNQYGRQQYQPPRYQFQ